VTPSESKRRIPLDLAQTLARACELHEAGRLAEAERLYRRVLNIRSDHAVARHRLGMLRFQQGRLSEALQLVGAALAVQPNDVTILASYAVLLVQAGRHEEALTCYDRALARAPGAAELHNDRGNTLAELGRREEALASYERALAARPEYPAALGNRGVILSNLNRHAEALACHRRVVTLAPDNAEAHNNCGVALSALKRNEEALASFERAFALAPRNVEILNNRGMVLAKLGRHAQALASYDAALALAPDNAEIHSGRIFALDFVPGTGFAEHWEARRRWWSALAKSHPATTLPHPNSPDPARPLTLGYVSADFREHSAAAAFGPVLRRHDRRQFRVVCYSGVIEADALTAEFRALADTWRLAQDLSDVALAAQVHADGVDILIDLSGHSAGNRLAMFAQKPAPVAVTAWGQATGTGLPAIDYLFSDPVAIPAAARGLFAEAICDLPCLLTFEAPSYAPPVAPLPAPAQGGVTFGCLNRFAKISSEVLAVWAHVLNAVPGSRLLLKDSALDETALQTFARETLARYGIGAERIFLRGRTPRAEHLATFAEIDIALDPFPQNGGVSTFEALWQGVPVIAQLGNGVPSRLAGAILSAAGLADWVAQNEDDYAALAARKASDLDGLARVRMALRSTVAASQAGNPDLYTRSVEDAYRLMWQRWCAAQADRRDREYAGGTPTI